MLETHADEIHELATFLYIFIYIFCKTLVEQALHALNMLYSDIFEKHVDEIHNDNSIFMPKL